MIKALIVECKKSRYRKLWIIVAALIGAQLLWELYSFRNMDTYDLAQGWLACLYHFPVLNAIFMPVITAVIASKLSDIEHKGQTLKLLETVMPAARLFDAKLLCGAFYVLSVILLQIGVMLLTGYVKGFTGPAPLNQMGYYLLFTFCVTVTLLLLQQILSLLFSNQMVSLTIGLLGGFVGLFSMYLPPWFSKLTPWGYYGVLMLTGMDWERETRIVTYYWSEIDWTGFLILVSAFLVIYCVGRILFVRKEM